MSGRKAAAAAAAAAAAKRNRTTVSQLHLLLRQKNGLLQALAQLE